MSTVGYGWCPQNNIHRIETPVPVMSNKNGGEDAVETTEDTGEPTILVSEFPPPPFYYKDAETLAPPPIPQEALERGTRKAAAAAAKARAMAERERLEQTETFDKTNSILGGVKANEQEEEEEGDVVAVFGQVVEDPLLVQPIDYCEDPVVVRDEVKRLNKCVVEGFVQLVQDLVHKPLDSK